MTALVLVAGALGAAARYLVEHRFTNPWGTYAVNVSGSFALGLLTGLHPPAHTMTVLGVGLLGAYTTFSAYAVEIVRIDAERSRALAAAYALGSLGSGVLAAGLGLLLGRLG